MEYELICYTLPHQYKCFVSVYEILTAEICGKLSGCTIVVKRGYTIIHSFAGSDPWSEVATLVILNLETYPRASVLELVSHANHHHHLAFITSCRLMILEWASYSDNRVGNRLWTASMA